MSFFDLLLIFISIYTLGVIIYWIRMRDVLSSHNTTFPSKWA